MNILIVVDMQNDFVNGCLGTPEAREIVPAVVDELTCNISNLRAQARCMGQYLYELEVRRY